MYKLRLKPTRKIFLPVCIFLFLASVSRGQNIKDSSLFFPLVKFSYAFQLPAGDLANRFGFNSNLCLDFSIKTKKNLIVGMNGSFFFGDQIKERGILDTIKTSTDDGAHTGFVINQNGNPEVVRLFERGLTVSLHIGKIFPIFSPNKNSGLVFYAGPTYIRHKIKLYDVDKQAQQLTKDYLKGYDRLTSGFGLHEFIGYIYFGNKRMLNFFWGFEFMQTFTKSQRSYDYDLMRADTQKRTDLLNGIRIGWILPLYRKTPQEFYYH